MKHNILGVLIALSLVGCEDKVTKSTIEVPKEPIVDEPIEEPMDECDDLSATVIALDIAYDGTDLESDLFSYADMMYEIIDECYTQTSISNYTSGEDAIRTFLKSFNVRAHDYYDHRNELLNN